MSTENINNKDIKVVSDSVKKHKMTREEMYKKERNEVLNKLNNIVGINGNENQGFFCLDDINEEKQQQILALKDDVCRFFACGKWSFFKKTDNNRLYLSLLKSIYKDMNYDIRQSVSYTTKNGIREGKVKVLVEKK